jgi:hypothetical protein
MYICTFYFPSTWRGSLHMYKTCILCPFGPGKEMVGLIPFLLTLRTTNICTYHVHRISDVEK